MLSINYKAKIEKGVLSLLSTRSCDGCARDRRRRRVRDSNPRSAGRREPVPGLCPHFVAVALFARRTLMLMTNRLVVVACGVMKGVMRCNRAPPSTRWERTCAHTHLGGRQVCCVLTALSCSRPRRKRWRRQNSRSSSSKATTQTCSVTARSA